MYTVQVRKQGGAAIITIPAHVLTELHLTIGAKLTLDVTERGFTAVPAIQKRRKRKRYTMKELLKGATPKRMRALMKSVEWFTEMKPVGREIL